MIKMFKPAGASLVDTIPYWGFVAPDVVLTVNGQLLFFAEITQSSIDGKSPADLDSVTVAWQKLLGSVEPPHRAFILFRRPEMQVPADFDELDDVAGLAQRKRLAYVCNAVRRMQAVLVVAFDPRLKGTVDASQSHWIVANIRRWLLDRRRQHHLSFLFTDVLKDAVAYFYFVSLAGVAYIGSLIRLPAPPRGAFIPCAGAHVGGCRSLQSRLFMVFFGRAPPRAVVFSSILLDSRLRVPQPRVAASSSPLLLAVRLLDWARSVSARRFRLGFSAPGRFSPPCVAYQDLFVCRHVALRGLYHCFRPSPSRGGFHAFFLTSTDRRCGRFRSPPVVSVDCFLSVILSYAPRRGVRGAPVLPPRGASDPLLAPSLPGAGPRSPGLFGSWHRRESVPRSCIPVLVQAPVPRWQRSGTLALPCSRSTAATRRLSPSSRRSSGRATRRSGA